MSVRHFPRVAAHLSTLPSVFDCPGGNTTKEATYTHIHAIARNRHHIEIKVVLIIHSVPMTYISLWIVFKIIIFASLNVMLTVLYSNFQKYWFLVFFVCLICNNITLFDDKNKNNKAIGLTK